MSNKTTKKRRSFIGIDVSKKLLELGVHQSDYHFRCPNDPKHFPTLISELISLRPARIVVEATGGLERPAPGFVRDWFAGGRSQSAAST